MSEFQLLMVETATRRVYRLERPAGLEGREHLVPLRCPIGIAERSCSVDCAAIRAETKGPLTSLVCAGSARPFRLGFLDPSTEDLDLVADLTAGSTLIDQKRAERT